MHGHASFRKIKYGSSVDKKRLTNVLLGRKQLVIAAVSYY